MPAQYPTLDIYRPAISRGEIGQSVHKSNLVRAHGIAWPLLAGFAIFFAMFMRPALPNGEWFQVSTINNAVLLIINALPGPSSADAHLPVCNDHWLYSHLCRIDGFFVTIGVSSCLAVIVLYYPPPTPLTQTYRLPLSHAVIGIIVVALQITNVSP